MRKKRAMSLITALIDIVIVVAILIILITLLIRFLQPAYSLSEEYSKAQLDEIERLMGELEEGEFIEHLIIATPGKTLEDQSRHFIVHFKEGISQMNFLTSAEYVTGDANNDGLFSVNFFNNERDKGRLCACYIISAEAIRKDQEGGIIFEWHWKGEYGVTNATATCSSCISPSEYLEVGDSEVVELRGFEYITITKNSGMVEIK
ncbi:hypothetical protein CMI41_01690 [Candidatus Pacearchaeota archaeon]|nr:hypothetical protein [Candidatus Pacearchaeota archaeon]|tara:strand:+ start:2559 stop:3173 length:615 start_codon:yes stop_codon:yes gene_type:complete